MSSSRRPRRASGTPERTTIALGATEKLVFDWWAENHGGASTTLAIRRLLVRATREDWDTLVLNARRKLLRCPKHGEELLLFDPTAKSPICRLCTSGRSLESRATLMRYCQRHAAGYYRYCSLCEGDRTRRELPLQPIRAADAVKAVEGGTALLLDVRRSRRAPFLLKAAYGRALPYTDVVDARNGKLVEMLRELGAGRSVIAVDDDGGARAPQVAGELVLRYDMVGRAGFVEGGVPALMRLRKSWFKGVSP